MGASPPTPSLADAFYLVMYPLAYLAIMLIMRGEIRSFKASGWLDGAVAGLGAAAICCAFVFDTIVVVERIAGRGGVNLAYPVGDLVLLAFAVSALVIVPGWPIRLDHPGRRMPGAGHRGHRLPVPESAAGSYQSGDHPRRQLDDGAVLAVAERLAAGRRTDGRTSTRGPGFVLPAVAAVARRRDHLHGQLEPRRSGVALGLTVATLVLVGVRAGCPAAELTALTRANHHQAVTDELTGLGNRRLLTQQLEVRSSTPQTTPGCPTTTSPC